MSLSEVGERVGTAFALVRATTNRGFTTLRGLRSSSSMSNVPVWAEQAPAPRPSLRGSIAADVCVVGLGGSGLSCARQLAAAGRDVVALDARGIAAGRNGGFLLGGLSMFHHAAVRGLGRTVAT